LQPLAVLPLAAALVTGCQQGSTPQDVAAAPSSSASGQPTTTTTAASPMTRSSPAMTDPSSVDSRSRILAVAEQRSRGMLERDVALLDEVLADDFTATHITGYEQPKDEWLAQVADGQMQYHSIREIDTDLQISGDTATAVTRNAVDATIGGSRNTWNLRSTTRFELRDGVWRIVASASTTF
jgi:uncharacterized lipoprotein YajG